MKHLKAFEDFYDYVIIDTPPLLAATDAQILASIADATLLVVDTKKSNVDKSLKQNVD